MNMKTMMILFAILVTPYLLNGYKLINCDFKSDYKCEVIHGIGAVIPPMAFITAWFGSDDD